MRYTVLVKLTFARAVVSFMKPKMMFKLGVDVVMIALLPCLMAYTLIGEVAHEWMGAAMFVLFILHHALNGQWIKNLAKGRYTALRTLQTTMDALVFLCMVGLMVSGVILSREVFGFLSIRSGRSFARTLHMLASYWGFLLMSFHLGMHWNMVMGLARRLCGLSKPSRLRTRILQAVSLAICVYGLYAFAHNHILDYMLLRTHFVFFDMDQPLIMFFVEYLAMMGLWATVGHYAALVAKATARKRARA